MLQTANSGRLLFLQYGSYAEAANRFAAGGEENYFGQRYTVDYVSQLPSRGYTVRVMSFGADEPESTLPTEVESVGLDLYPKAGEARIGELILSMEEWKPDQLVICTPLVPALRWARRKGVRTLPLFADSFPRRGWKGHLKNMWLRRELNRPEFEWISNHNIASCLDLARIGVDTKKLLPFDWPPLVTPDDYVPRTRSTADGSMRLLYVGSLMESKGVGDTVRAIARCRDAGRDVSLTLIGSGEESRFENLSASLGVTERVDFAGKLPHAEVLRAMLDHDALIIPSRHEYPEGLPMTIYEGMCTHTPIIASDHPMFSLRIRPDRDALVFGAGDDEELTRSILTLSEDNALYRRLSTSAGERAREYLCPLKWHRLIDLWLQQSPASTRELASYSLETGRYVD